MDVLTRSQRDDLTARGRAASLRLAELVRSLDARRAARPVPGLGWNAAETAAHVVNLYGRGLGDMRRSATPEATAALNATCLDEYAERDPATVADRIAADATTCWDVVFPTLPDDRGLLFHASARTTIVPIMGVLLMEVLAHGDDIGRATDRPWSIDDDDAWCALAALAPLLPAWQRPGVTAHDTIALLGPTGDAMRIASHRDSDGDGDGDGGQVTVTIGPVLDGDRVTPEAPAAALLGILGRRPCGPPLADLARRFGPF